MDMAKKEKNLEKTGIFSNCSKNNCVRKKVKLIRHKCRLFGDIDETVHHIIRDCSKLVKKEYKTKHYWVRNVIDWESYKRLKFDHTKWWYICKENFIGDNETYKFLLDQRKGCIGVTEWKIWSTKNCVRDYYLASLTIYAQTRICPRKCNAFFWVCDKMDNQILCRRNNPVLFWFGLMANQLL